MEFLFGKGTARMAYPIKLMLIETPVELQYPAQAMFVVPKRNFKRSPDRNTLKRRMREVYRLNKGSLYNTLQSKKIRVLLAFIYTGKKKEEYPTIEKALNKLLQSFDKE